MNKMNSVKITYIICVTIMELTFFILAMLAPIYVTPGVYWWTAGCIFMVAACGHRFTQRANSWRDFGEVDE